MNLGRTHESASLDNPCFVLAEGPVEYYSDMKSQCAIKRW
jgi:hypothetical protein